MNPFVRYLVQRLFDAKRPLSRNRYFYTFQNKEGQRALRIHKRLKALQKALTECRNQGGALQIARTAHDNGSHSIVIRLTTRIALHTAWLEEDEFKLLQQLPDVPEALRKSLMC